MEKRALIILGIILLFVSIIGISLLKDGLITGNLIFLNTNSPNYSTYTKAICDNNNFCQDYVITCQDGEVIEQSPITGAFVQQDEDWQDPRNGSQKEIICQN